MKEEAGYLHTRERQREREGEGGGVLTSPMLSEGNLEANLSIGFQFILCDGGKMKRERERERV